MRREDFMELVGDALDSLPKEFRRRMKNVAVLVEDVPAEQRERERQLRKNDVPPRPRGSAPRTLVLGHFIGTMATQKSVFDLPRGPDHVILYQRNIEAVCRTEQEIREQVRLTLIHEVGHYFGMSEEQLRDV
jgi:predicted Zn-dependent protease with MMP-like domain